MGMGEPLANYDNLLQALRILNAPWGGGIGARRITISTSGLAPQIRRLAEEPAQFRLAISLHGRDRRDARAASCLSIKNIRLPNWPPPPRYYQEKKGGMMTLEYILIAGVNDGLDQVKPLARTGPPPWREGESDPLQPGAGAAVGRPPEEAARRNSWRPWSARRFPPPCAARRAQDIDAACGQFRLKTERELRGVQE